MCVCSKCNKPYPEYELTWIEIIPEDHIQILWTGRGRGESTEKKMEVICDNCIEEYSTTSFSSSLSC